MELELEFRHLWHDERYLLLFLSSAVHVKNRVLDDTNRSRFASINYLLEAQVTGASLDPCLFPITLSISRPSCSHTNTPINV